MINVNDILETIRMILDENLDIRTITMGISLLDCIDADIDKACSKVYEKITRCAKAVSYTHLPASSSAFISASGVARKKSSGCVWIV